MVQLLVDEFLAEDEVRSLIASAEMLEVRRDECIKSTIQQGRRILMTQAHGMDGSVGPREKPTNVPACACYFLSRSLTYQFRLRLAA